MIEEGWAELRPIYADSDEYRVFVELREQRLRDGRGRLDSGLLRRGEWVFVSDDRDARREANRRGVGVVGTYGVLARQVAEGRMDLEEGNTLLRRMIEGASGHIRTT